MRLLKTALFLLLGAVTIQPLQAQAVIGSGLGPQTTAAWTSATAQNTVLTSQLAFSTPVGGTAGPGYSTVVVAFNPSGSITGGVLTFEATTDPNGNANWQSMTCSRIGLAPAADPTYTLTGGAQIWQCDVAGLAFFRSRLSTVVSGTGTVNLTSQASVAIPSYELAYASASQLTAAINNGATLYEKGPRWQVTVASTATPSASKAAGAAGVRHVADCVSFALAGTGAVTATALAVNLRDGATGAGTLIWTQVLEPVTAAAGTVGYQPFTACGLNLIGSAATAMTLEILVGAANLVGSVSLSGYDVQ